MRWMGAAIVLMLAGTQAGAAGLADPLTCLLQPDRKSDIGSDTGGIVAALAVRRADQVAKGDVLLQLDDRIARAEMKKAEINLQNVNDRLKRAEALTAGKVISADEIGSLRAEAAMADADALRARLQVDRARITAPFSGTIAAVMTEEGQLIGIQPLLTLIDTRQLRAELVFPAEAFGAVKTGDVLTIGVDLVGRQVAGTVVSTDPYLDAASNSFSVVAVVPNADGGLPAGTGCRLVH